MVMKIPGRKLLRPDFPPGQPPQKPNPSLDVGRVVILSESEGSQRPQHPDSSLNVAHAQISPIDDSSIADAETAKMPPPPLESNRVHPIADADTQEMPPLRFESNPDATIADIETTRMFSFSVASNPVDAIVEAETQGMPPLGRKKTGRVQFSKRRKTLLIALAVGLLIPSFIVIFELINAIALYQQAQDGIAHLQAVQAIFHSGSGTSGGITQYFDLHKLDQAQQAIDTAHQDFATLSDKLDHDGAMSLIANLWPTQISTMRSLGHIATDGTAAAQILIKTVIGIAPSIAAALQQNPSQSDNALLKPYITPSSFQNINNALDAIEPLLSDMNNNAHGLALNSLPISNSQRQMLASVLPLLPSIQAGLSQERQLRSALAWLLGIDSQRAFLVEPMDSAELRATGGFTGQFGELILNGAHVGPLHLENLGKYEEDHTAEGSPPDKTIYPKVIGQTAPAPYSAWWPVANFGLRDANLSADFPTSARIAMDRYAYEFGNHVDGVIMFTPTLIKEILHVTGPITIPAYHQTITEQNLVDRLHYYQLDNRGIRYEEIVEHVNDPQLARKLFTQRVTSTLISTVSHLPISKLLPMANQMLHSMKTKDLQVYVTNPQIESLIAKYGSTASLDRSTTHDGLFIVQSNLSASKASQYVSTAIQDTITLDTRGGATHHVQITLNYQQKGDVFGFDTYRDYLRVYVPPHSQLLAGNGFDQYDQPYCGDAQSTYPLCQQDVYGNGSLICSQPVTIGYATSYVNDPYAGTDHPLDRIGKPQNLQSDEPGRAMFAGWVVIPKNCTMKVTLSWYVPPMDQHQYHLLFQSQASVYGPLDLTIQPAQNTCLTNNGNSLHSSTLMDGEDTNVTVEHKGTKCSLTVN